MTGAANDRRGLVQRIRDARHAYRGPFTGEHVRSVVLTAGYIAANEGVDGEFLVFHKVDRRPIPVNLGWRSIWDGDPIFRCLQRDLDLSRSDLRMRLNRAKQAVE